jgi:AcrR family transcriptional regulator
MSSPSARRRRLTTRAPDATRTRILASARRRFAIHGYAATTTAAIAHEAHVSEGMIFHWFASKEALVAAVAREFAGEIIDAMFGGRGPTDEPTPSIGAMVRRTYAFCREHRALVRLLTLSPDPSSSTAARQASRDAMLAPLTATFVHRMAKREVRAMDARVVAELTFALVEAGLVECHVFGDGSREEVYLKETIRCVEGALGTSRAALQRREPPRPLQRARRTTRRGARA